MFRKKEYVFWLMFGYAPSLQKKTLLNIQRSPIFRFENITEFSVIYAS